MCFYLEPSSGKIDLSLLQKCAERRLEFLIKIRQTDTTDNKNAINQFICQTFSANDSDCLIEGTKKDVISHFLLRLALCDENDTTHFMINAELSLFACRFLCMTEDELYRSFKRLDTTVKRLCYHMISSDPSLCYLNELADVLRSILNSQRGWRKIAKLYLQGCENEYFNIPFTFALGLVSRRLVTLQRGIASIPYCKLKEVMKELFIYHLHYGFKHAKIQRQKIVANDDRMRKLFKSLKIQLRQKYKSNIEHGHMITNISHDQVNSEVVQFPPCMVNLHQALRSKHRLRHHSRIQYTLFLKDIGMSVHDALWFWKKEYNEVPENTTGCQHAWKKNEHRYVYNIRHLYGLEGSCINYKGHCCTSLQSVVQLPGENGGCPFKHSDEAHLKDLLCISSDSDLEQQILVLKNGGHYSSACQIYLEKKMQNVKKNMGTVSRKGINCTESYKQSHHCEKRTGCQDLHNAEKCIDSNCMKVDVEMDKTLNGQNEIIHANKRVCSIGQKRKMLCETNHEYSHQNLHVPWKLTDNADVNKKVCPKYIKTENLVVMKNSTTQITVKNTVSDEKNLNFCVEKPNTSNESESVTKVTDKLTILSKDRFNITNSVESTDSGMSSNFDCYDHDLCPSQFCHAERSTIRTRENETDLVNTIKLSKPADFYFSLRRLIDGLKLLK